jgi:hypothetical protein
MPIESTPLMPPWTLTANLTFMENFNGPGRGVVLGFSGLESMYVCMCVCVNHANNNAPQNMGRLGPFGVSP